MTGDLELLQDYARNKSEGAFTALVNRHLNLVYSAALRQVRSPQLAEEVAQAVFVNLSHSATRLRSDTILTAWLYQVTRRTAIDVVRRESRRQLREQIATEMNAMNATDANWAHIEPLLDEAMEALDETDRAAVLLRYFENKSLRDVGQTLGASDDAAQKRVGRAVERLREFFAKRGVAVGAGGLAVVISANAVQAASAGLAAAISAAALLSEATLAAATTLTTAKVVAMTTMQKALVAAAVVALAGLGIYQTHQASGLRNRIEILQQQTLPALASSNAATLAALQEKLDSLQAQNAGLTAALAQASADKTRLETEREQARRAATLYKELSDVARTADANPTNAYPTERHVWVGWGRFGRMAALSKEGDGKLSPEDKSTLEAAQIKLLEELPRLVKAAKQYEAAKSSRAEQPTVEMPDEVMDMMTCILYGALNLDEQQFNQVYGAMQRLGQEANLKGISKESPEAAEAVRFYMEKWKAETLTLLTPEQSRVFAEVVNHFQVEPGHFGFNFSF